MSSTQLPDDLDVDILWDEHSALIGDDIDDLNYWSGRDVMKKDDFIKAIAPYTTKLHQAEDKIVSLQRKVEKLSEENYDISGQMGSLENSTIRQTEAFCESIRWGETARTLLEKVATRHEAGLLPDPLLYTEIKTFLDGTK